MAGPTAVADRANPRFAYFCLWPGLAAAWLRGDWAGLATAAVFTLFLNAAVLATVAWSEMLGSAAALGLWSTVAVAWVAGFIGNRRLLRGMSTPVDERAAPGDLFPEAMAEYLRGNWIGVEQACRELIRRRRDDADSRLLLAAALRRSGRFVEARRTLDDLAKLDAGQKWSFEVAEERRLLDEAHEEAVAGTISAENQDSAGGEEPDSTDGSDGADSFGAGDGDSGMIRKAA